MMAESGVMLCVQAKVLQGTSLVAYTVLSGPAPDGTSLKVTRFSELDAFHTRLIKEVPAFRGRLPAKTLKRRTSADFVEARRKEIEAYIRLVSADPHTSQSAAWKSFMEKLFAPPAAANMPPPTDSMASAAEAETVLSKDKDDSEDELCTLDNSMNDEMKELMLKRRDELKEAEQAKKHLEGTISSGSEALKSVEQGAHEKASLEAEAAARLRSHRVGLEGLDSELASKQVKSRDTELQQLELAKRLSEQLSVASDATKKAQVKFEAARRACMESSAQIRSNVAAGTAKKVEADARNGAAIERHAAMSAVLNVLQDRVKSRQDEVKAAERDRDARRAVNLAAASESSEAEALRRQAESESNAASTAVNSHLGDAARRIRAHEVEVRRAQERASKAASLRDMRTRGLVMGDDRGSLEPAENAANVAAECLHSALSMAEQLRDETKAKDVEKRSALEAIAKKASLKLRDRERVSSALAGRVDETDGAVRTSSAAYAAAHAALKAVEEELETIKQRVEGPLAKALPECAGALEETTKTLQACKKKGDEDQTPLRHSEDAEAQLLKSQQQAEETFVQELDEAQMVAAEAHEDAAVFSDTGSGTDKDKTPGPDVDLLVKSAAARVADHERNANNAANSHKEVVAQVDATQQELNAIVPSDEKSFEVDHTDERRAALEARLKDLEQVAEEKAAASKAAAATADAAKEELEDVKTRQKSAPKRAEPLEKLIRDELTIVDGSLKTRQEEENAILGEVNARKQAWLKEKEALGADLHRAQLQAAVAEEGVSAASGLAKSLRQNK